MKQKITVITFLLMAIINNLFAQVSLTDFKATSTTESGILFSTVKVWVYVISACAIIVSSLGLLITLKKNSVLKEQGDATKPIINFVVFIIASLIAVTVTTMISGKFGFS